MKTQPVLFVLLLLVWPLAGGQTAASSRDGLTPVPSNQPPPGKVLASPQDDRLETLQAMHQGVNGAVGNKSASGTGASRLPFGVGFEHRLQKMAVTSGRGNFRNQR